MVRGRGCCYAAKGHHVEMQKVFWKICSVCKSSWLHRMCMMYTIPMPFIRAASGAKRCFRTYKCRVQFFLQCVWEWLNVCVCTGARIHKTQPALLLHCTWLHCTFVFYDIKDQPWSPKDLWSLRHWWTLCLLMINMLWWFLKISKIHPYNRPYDLCLWSSLQLIRGLLHPYDHYNASFEGCFSRSLTTPQSI